MNYQILLGDCIQSLSLVPDKSVHCCVTSPPYYALRDYGIEGQIGLEETPEQFIKKLVEVFSEVRRVLRDDGTLWVNIGDSYWGGGSTTEYGNDFSNFADKCTMASVHPGGSKRPVKPRKHPLLKAKQLIGIPWRLAFALQQDGWYLRQEIIWHKPNPMPESVKDRCTKAHEQIFLLSKSPRYYFDSEAMKEDAVGGQTGKAASFKRDGSKREQTIPGQTYGTHRQGREDVAYNGVKRNRRSVWSVATRPYKGAHFATFPPALIEPCVLAGSPVGGVVLDPFGGSGTTAGVAVGHGRYAIICEINPSYSKLVPDRVESIVHSITSTAGQGAHNYQQCDLFDGGAA